MSNAKSGLVRGTGIKPQLEHGVYIPPSFTDEKEWQALMLQCVRSGVSDIYLNTGKPLTADIWGKMHTLTVSGRRITQSEATVMLGWMMAEGVITRVNSGDPQPSSYSITDPDQTNKTFDGSQVRYRFRVNASRVRYRSDLGIQVVIRILQSEPPRLVFEEDLADFGYVPGQVYVPRDMFEGMLSPNGLSLISGPTGSGKTTTFAGMLRALGEWEDSPIRGNYCIGESPTEFVFDSVMSSHSDYAQQEIGSDVGSFADFVRDLMRRHPALGVIGEIRDTETCDAAMQLALTGHPVWATVHTNDVPSIIPRLLTQYTPDARPAAMADLIGTSRMLINQTLEKTLDGRRTVLRSYLQITPKIQQNLALSTSDIDLKRRITKFLFSDGVSKTAAAQKALERGLIDVETVKRVAAREEAAYE